MNVLNNNHKDVIKDGNVTIYISASWCGPCKMLSPIVERVSSDHNIWKADADTEADLCQEYNIRSVPTLLFFKDGQLVKSKIGSMSENQLINELNY